MSASYLRSKEISELDPQSKENMLPLHSMSMGENVSAFLARRDIGAMRRDINGFFEHVQLFYIEAASQLKDRLPLNDAVIKSLSFLNPSTIPSTMAQEVIKVGKMFPNIIAAEELRSLDEEWRSLQYSELPSFT